MVARLSIAIQTRFVSTAWIKFAGVAGRLFVSAAAALLIAVLPLRAAKQETRVLFLIATHPYVPGLLALDSSMRDELAWDPTQKFQFFSESLDAQRFSFGDFEQEFEALLAKKYKNTKIDIIVAVTKPALDFANRHGDLWPDAAILFHSIPTHLLDGVSLTGRIKGVREGRNIGKTLDLAHRLQPDATRILAVAGVSDYDEDFTDEARKVIAARNESAEIRYLIGLPQQELVDVVLKEPATIVLYLSPFRDREGTPYTPRGLLRAISAKSSAPTYGMFDSYLGHGNAVGLRAATDEFI